MFERKLILKVLMKRLILIALAVPAFLAAIPHSFPSAGVVEREIEREYESKPFELKREIPTIEVDIPDERFSMASDVTVFIQNIEIEGNTVITEKDIQKCIRGYCGQELTLCEIYQICACIDQLYAAKGYFLTRAYPPPQDITDGRIVLRVLEGRIGTITIEGNQYYSTSFIYNYFKPFCHKPLQYDHFLKALLLLNENADLSVAVLFEKGADACTADLIVRVYDERPIHLYLNENNYGRPLTTSAQLGGRIDWGNCFVQGDTFSLAEVVGFPLNALFLTDAIYTVPLNTQGTYLSLGYLYSMFHIEEYKSFHLRGKSTIATLKGTQAITRTKTLAIDLFSYFDYKQIQNFVLDQTTSFDKLRVITGGVLVDHYNSYCGRDYLNLRVAAGIPNFLGGLGPESRKASRVGGGGRFVQFNLDYDRLQRLYTDYMLYFHVSGQWSPSKLTLPQQLYIGGSSSVRGYPLSVALGDSGYYSNFEVRFPLPKLKDKQFFLTNKTWGEVLQIVTFVDTGATFYNDGPSTYITGAGFGFRVIGPYTISLSFDIGFPLNHHNLSSGPYAYLKITAQPF